MPNIPTGSLDNSNGETVIMDTNTGNMTVDNAWSISGLENGFDLTSFYLDPSLYVDLN